MANGVARIGPKENHNLLMLLVLILLLHATTHWTVLVDHMTKIALILKDAAEKAMQN
tara:strand:- start:856 stop:1026 length:171 start_codon:yes stop_codon:yes gene_type:complete